MNNSHFCPLPWTGFDIMSEMTIKPCCKMSNDASQPFTTITNYLESKKLQDIKQQFLNGEKPKECDRCWADESANIKSKRQMFVEKNQPLNSIQYITLPLGKICNLACSTCGPWSSSKWETEAKKYPMIGVVKSDAPYIRHDYLSQQDIFDDIVSIFPSLTEVELHGGEPLYSKQHLPILKKLLPYAENIKLRYITNCTIKPSNEIISYWKKFKHIDILMSIDGICSVFEYTRWPANWKDTLENIMFFKNLDFIQISVSHTVSIFNVLDIDEFSDWCHLTLGIEPYIGMVSGRMPLNIMSFPENIKESIKNQITNKKIIEYMMLSDNSRYWDLSIKNIEAYNTIRNTPIKNYLPKLDNILRLHNIII